MSAACRSSRGVGRALRGWVVALLVAAAAGSSGEVAHAAEPTSEDLAHAREEYRRGLALEQAGDWEGALAAFKAVARVKSTPQVRFHVALCEEHVGHWVEAVGSYRLALAEARAAGVADVEHEAEAALAALEPRVPHLTLVRGRGAAAASVRLDGRELGPSSVGAAIAVDPGPHRVEARAPGRVADVHEIVAAAGETASITLELDAAAPAPLAPVVPAGAVDDGASALVPIGVVAMGVGGVSLAASGVFYGLRQGAIGELDDACGADRQGCPSDLRATADRGATYSTVATATFIAGVSSLALGATLLVVDLAGRDPTTTGRGGATRVVVGAGSAAVVGRF